MFGLSAGDSTLPGFAGEAGCQDTVRIYLERNNNLPPAFPRNLRSRFGLKIRSRTRTCRLSLSHLLSAEHNYHRMSKCDSQATLCIDCGIAHAAAVVLPIATQPLHFNSTSCMHLSWIALRQVVASCWRTPLRSLTIYNGSLFKTRSTMAATSSWTPCAPWARPGTSVIRCPRPACKHEQLLNSDCAASIDMFPRHCVLPRELRADCLQ